MDYADKAEELFRSGLSCAQAVSMALSPKVGLDENMLKALSAPFGAGFARMREVCGAVSGMLMIIGYAHPELAKRDIYALSREAMEEFKSVTGSYVCREILKTSAETSAVPSERTSEYYTKRVSCITCVRTAAAIADKFTSRPTGVSHSSETN